MVVVKHVPEDFVVEEVLNLPGGEGTYTYYLLTKRNVAMFNVMDYIAKAFHVQKKYLNFPGLKDKRGVTKQYFSILGGPKKNLEQDTFSVDYVGEGEDRLNKGFLNGNKFTIVVRDIDNIPTPPPCFVNYFDSQRFGMYGNNHHIGLHILRGEYDEAVALLEENTEAMEGSNAIAKIKSIKKQQFHMYVYAYQSWVWNRTVAQFLSKGKIRGEHLDSLYFPSEKLEQMQVPVIGFLTELDKSPFEDIITNIMKEDKITSRSFLLHRISGESFDGSTRSLLTEVKDLGIGDLEDDDAFPEKKKCTLSFYLGKGSYATMVIKSIFS